MLAIVGFEAAAAAPELTDGQSTGRWFVELNTSAAAFHARAAASGIEYRERYIYNKVWKGLSVEATAEAASLLGKVQGVTAVYPVLVVPRPETQPASPELAHALAMTRADVAQSELGLTGAGIKVAVMDTGIDYHHPDLGGGFGPGYRVATGYDFVGDRYNAAGSGGDLIPHPDNDPDDCAGHGTHVAGIIGASGDPATGGARGVAPRVTFGAYRVFGCTGSTSADIMLAAMERALDDGMHVLNMSIGSAFQTWPQYPTAAGADALVAAGMVVVASIGNSGASGLYSASAPGVGRNVIGVASFDNSHVALPVFTVSPDNTAIGYTNAAAAPPAPTSGSSPMARTGTTASTADACASQGDLGDLTGKVALIRRGTCGFYEKARRAQLAGAAGVALYNNVAGRINPTVAVAAGADGQPVTIPVVAISDTEGALINGRLATGPVTMTWTADTAIFANPTAGLASSFTSYGLTAELDLKPDVGAPGGLIRSTYPLEAGGYATISGTSMAAPHVAGATALLLEARPGASPAAVRTALQNTAGPRPFSGNPGFLEHVHRQGAGMVDIYEAIVATSEVTPSKLSLGEGTGANPKAVTLTIANKGTAEVTYSLSHAAALATSPNTFAPGASTHQATVSFGASSVTVPAGGSATVNATITPPTSQGRVYGGYLVLTPDGDATQLLVPYAGFSGDYQAIQVLAAGGCGLSPFPGIFKLGGETACTSPAPPAVPAKLDVAVTRQAAGAVFNVEDSTDRPVILYHRAHQSRRLEIRAVEATTSESHLVASSDYVSRNAANGISIVAGGFSAYVWDGKALFTSPSGRVQRRELPSGTYKLQLVVTKALAEAGNADHVETWTSPAIIITR